MVEVVIHPLELLQLVVVDGGVAEDTDLRCQLLHQVTHVFVVAPIPCNAQSPQNCGVDAVTVALDDREV